MIVLYIILAIVSLYLICTTREPKEFQKLREKYQKFIDVVPPKYEKLKNKTVLTCLTSKREPGYSVNKGYEIAICYDKDVNSMFHVLLHELAHCTVDEYKHSTEFWNNLKELKNIAVQNNLYIPINSPKNFCGKTKISD